MKCLPKCLYARATEGEGGLLRVAGALRRSLACLVAGSAVCVAIPACGQVNAQFQTAPRSLITRSVDRAERAEVPGVLRAKAGSLRDMGEADVTLPMEHVQLRLRRPAERQAAFDAAVEALHTSGNPCYHQWLTPSVIGAEFGLSGSDIATLRAYLESEGFTINFVSPGNNLIDFTGTSAQIEHSFQTRIHSVQMASGEFKYAAVEAASIPAALAPAVAGFVSLSNVSVPRPLLRKPLPMEQTAAYLAQARGWWAQNTQLIDRSTYYNVGPQDFYTIYNETPLLTAASPVNGMGQTIALLEESDIQTADVTAFRTMFKVTPNTPALAVLHGAGAYGCGDPGVLNSNADDEEGEAILDTEWAGAVAPDAALLVMSCASTNATAGIFLSAEAVIYNNLASSMSLSYGESEEELTAAEEGTISDLWEEAAAQGETVVVSSGDSGSDAADQGSAVALHGLNVNGFSSTAYNVSAGGTDFQDAYNQGLSDTAFQVSTFWNATNTAGESSARSYVPETTWNDTCAGSLASYYVTGSSSPTAFCDTATGYSDYLTPVGGGGGISAINALPSFQNASIYGLPAGVGYRMLPDISLFASNGFWGHLLNYFESDVSGTALQFGGGTSFVAPQLAGVFALISESTGERQGQPDYVLYTMAGMEYGRDMPTGACNGSGALGTGSAGSLPDSNCIFNDIETGNISQPCSRNSVNCYVDSGSYGILATNPSTNLSTNPPAQAAYAAGEGYDLATGLGSINITNLVDNWQRTNKSALFTPAVTLATSLAPSTYGVPTTITYTATVSGTGSFPTGSVAFSGSPAIGTIGAANELAISAGCEDAGNCTESTTQSYLPLATLAGGSYTITATYSPTNENYTSGSDTIGLTINKQSPTLTADNDSTPFGNATVRLTAMLSFAGAGDVPTGGVNFSVNGGSVVPGACSGTTSPITCTASYPVASLAAGNYLMSVSYPGDVNYNAIGPVTAAVSVYSNPSALRFTVASPQHTMLPTIDLSAYSNNTSGPLIFSVVSGPATVEGSVATLTGAGTVELEVSQAAGTVYSLTTATTTFSVLAGSIWIADSGGGISIFDLLGNSISTRSGFGDAGGTIATPQGVAFDGSGDLWVASSSGVSEFTRYGAASTSIPLTVGGVSNPLSLAIDGDGTVWVANANGSVSAISNAGTALSPGAGYPVGARASTSGGIAVDLSGNVWVTNNGGNTVTEILGAAAPVAPLSTSLANNTVGGKP